MEAKSGKFNFYKKNVFGPLVFVLVITFLLIIWHPGYWFWLLIIFPIGLLLSKVNKFITGLEGEASVGDELKKLPSGFTCLSDVVIGSRGNIDKVVIGPTGIWVLEIKSHRGNIRQPNEKFLNQVWAESYAVRDLIRDKLNLNIIVQPVLVFSNPRAYLHFGFKTIKGVYIIQSRWLNNLITKHSSFTLDPNTISKITRSNGSW